jgi:hypothetical protein
MVVLRVRTCIAVEIRLIPVAVASENAETRIIQMGKRKLPNSTHNCPSIGTLYVMLKDTHHCEERV